MPTWLQQWPEVGGRTTVTIAFQVGATDTVWLLFFNPESGLPVVHLGQGLGPYSDLVFSRLLLPWLTGRLVMMNFQPRPFRVVERRLPVRYDSHLLPHLFYHLCQSEKRVKRRLVTSYYCSETFANENCDMPVTVTKQISHGSTQTQAPSLRLFTGTPSQWLAANFKSHMVVMVELEPVWQKNFTLTGQVQVRLGFQVQS